MHLESTIKSQDLHWLQSLIVTVTMSAGRILSSCGFVPRISQNVSPLGRHLVFVGKFLMGQ